MQPKPKDISVEGVNIRSKVIAIENGEEVIQINGGFNLEQFYQSAKQYVTPEGWFNWQIVPRRTPSSKGHTHRMRVACSINEKVSD